MTTYEEASRRWAAKRTGTPIDQIKSVEFEVAADGYDTSGYYGVIEADMTLTDGKRVNIPLGDHGLGSTDLPSLLKDLFDA